LIICFLNRSIQREEERLFLSTESKIHIHRNKKKSSYLIKVSFRYDFFSTKLIISVVGLGSRVCAYVCALLVILNE